MGGPGLIWRAVFELLLVAVGIWAWVKEGHSLTLFIAVGLVALETFIWVAAAVAVWWQRRSKAS